MEERCICCGDIIPEGRQVCPACEAKVDSLPKTQKNKPKRRAKDDHTTTQLWARDIR